MGYNFELLDPSTCNTFLTAKGVSWRDCRLVLQGRFGCYPCRALLFARDPPAAPTPRCPHCNRRDSTFHAVTALCPPMKNLSIIRANKSAQILCERVRLGTLGACRILLHAGTSTAAVQQRTIPPYIIPYESLPLNANGSRVACPDFALISGWPTHKRGHPTPSSPGVVLILLEMCFCDDAFMTERLHEKRAYYAPLLAALRAAGWTVLGFDDATGDVSPSGPHILVLPIGHSGLLPSYARRSIFPALGLSPVQSLSLARRLNIHAAAQSLA